MEERIGQMVHLNTQELAAKQRDAESRGEFSVSAASEKDISLVKQENREFFNQKSTMAKRRTNDTQMMRAFNQELQMEIERLQGEKLKQSTGQESAG